MIAGIPDVMEVILIMLLSMDYYLFTYLFTIKQGILKKKEFSKTTIINTRAKNKVVILITFTNPSMYRNQELLMVFILLIAQIVIIWST